VRRNPILIVDDDDGIREALQLSVEMFGYPAVCAAQGAEALEQLATIPRPGLILLDLMMPVMDGWAFAEAISQNKELADIPIVVITAFTDRASALPKAKRVLSKPFDIDLLLETIRQYYRGEAP